VPTFFHAVAWGKNCLPAALQAERRVKRRKRITPLYKTIVVVRAPQVVLVSSASSPQIHLWSKDRRNILLKPILSIYDLKTLLLLMCGVVLLFLNHQRRMVDGWAARSLNGQMLKKFN